MIEIHTLRNRSEEVIKKLRSRQISNAAEQVVHLQNLDQRRRDEIQRLEEDRQEMNRISRSIGQLMQQKKREEAEAAKAQTGALKQRIRAAEDALAQTEAEFEAALVQLPNLTHESVPEGKNADDNVVVTSHGEAEGRSFDFDHKPHWELADQLNLIDFELGTKVTGAGFPVYLGKGARLQRALVQFFLDRATAEGYVEVQPPLVVNQASAFGTGQLPDKEGQMYHITAEDLYLIPTAEVPITNLYRDVILENDRLPVRHCGYTPCFRREAGSYGKDVRGLNRLHQFDKVELVQVVSPAHSYTTLETMTTYVMSLLRDLELPYRQLLLCTGDTGFTAAKTYDLEVYSPGQSRWLEVSSVSNFETFQSNRLKLRYRDEDRKTQLAHTLNGSALALPRIVAALLENHQRVDGSVAIPAALRPYTGFDAIEPES